ncbi:MAG: DNA polymerase III subunit gamma/tau [Gammaproteobacteria bacterium]|nr:DNA polymerase III subunit gamma/tau [Gammaproteobacteria bacterium]
MSYQVLARKYRPTLFSEVAGQSHVLKSLINALDNQRLHHAYLFTGTRGVGKTTLARILARCLNCEQGVSATPCGECSACVEISQGRFIDLIEVDAASRTKVEDTRELLENVQYLPTRGRYKVYLIDEVHMLSTHSFNALLKTLEEPPEHVKFLLATTDPQKLPITVLSRCLQFNLKNLSPQLIAEFVSGILDKESVGHESDALWQIATAAAGSMRDALTLTDQAISFCEGSVVAAGVTEMLGVPPQQQISRLLEAMATRNVADVLALVRDIGEQTPDYQHSLDALLSMLHRIAMAQAVPESVDDSNGDKARVQALAAQLTAEDVQLYYQIGLKGREDLRLALEMRGAFEMILLRMLVFSPQFTAPAEKKKTEPLASSSQTAAISTSGLDAELKPKFAQELVAEAAPVVAAESKPELKPERKPEPKSEPKSEPARGVMPRPDSLTPETWVQRFSEIGFTGLSANIMANSELVEYTGEQLRFVLGTQHSAVFNDEVSKKLEPVLERFLGHSVAVSIVVGETQRETPAEAKLRSNSEAQAARIDEFQQDPLVRELVEKLDGEVLVASIQASSGEIT